MAVILGFFEMTNGSLVTIPLKEAYEELSAQAMEKHPVKFGVISTRTAEQLKILITTSFKMADLDYRLGVISLDVWQGHYDHCTLMYQYLQERKSFDYDNIKVNTIHRF